MIDPSIKSSSKPPLEPSDSSSSNSPNNLSSNSQNDHPKNSWGTIFIQSVKLTILLAILTGIVFPMIVTATAQLVFPFQANGSLLKDKNGTIIGSAIIGQQFTSAKYFHARPSPAGSGYAAEASGASNLGPTSKKLFEGVVDDPKTPADEKFLGIKQLAQNYRQENKLNSDAVIPVDAVTRSCSGLDPDITLSNARLQIQRVADARHRNVAEIKGCLDKTAEGRQLGVLGEPRVNVVRLNLVLDQL